MDSYELLQGLSTDEKNNNSLYMIKIVGEYGITVESYKIINKTIVKHGIFTFYDLNDKQYKEYIEYLDGVKQPDDITQKIFSNRTEFYSNRMLLRHVGDLNVQYIPYYIKSFIKSSESIIKRNLKFY